jgi:hypothetical protein
MNRTLSAVLVTAVALFASSCGSAGPSESGNGADIRVLFIGNSLTYSNDLPRMVEILGAAAGEHIVTESVALADYALIDHWNDGDVQSEIHDGHFDYVVLQQGPSTLAVNRDSLRLVTALFNPVIRESGAVPALFAVWPETERFSAFPIVAESYYLAAQDVGGVYLPVGDTWLATWNAREDAPLYGGDGYHPGLAGSYAAAVVIVAKFTNRNPESFPLDVAGIPLDQGLMSTIHSAAQATITSNTLLPR